ncbi:hypothetical protein PV10_08026 [Exophiala mesophila]|uniref:F-box domain-containing protein n=1 Tax=Exophiala mesophila TaxID=212818 RepID=A0A0D1Z334_EXOME|nr:uncharacterized protein PV10_08026 [Exophiala mesophila]KIV88334.1 hypothetical protein PV10_08026 [Exophiala mesophila]
MALLELPPEILSHIMTFVGPPDISSFATTCKQAHTFASPQNQLLWKAAFLSVFDDPADAWAAMPVQASQLRKEQWHWHRELRLRFLALRMARSKYVLDFDHANALAYVDTILDILDTTKFTPSPRDIKHGRVPTVDDRTLSRNLQVLSEIDQKDQGLVALIHDTGKSATSTYPATNGNPWTSPLRPRTRSVTQAEDEKNRPENAARLHVLNGLTKRELENRLWGAARRKVYNWHLTGSDNDYGPFQRNGSGKVDWPLLEAVFCVIARNFKMCVRGHLTMPQGFCFSIPHRTLTDPIVPEDWARVTGPWLGTYAFLDYADLFAFNAAEALSIQPPTLDDEEEACGDLMTLDLKLDPSLSSDRKLHTLLPYSTELPVLYFSGLSRANLGLRRPAIGVRGMTCLIPGGREVRWRFIISYGGQDQWQLEGVQPGGVRSGGVFGLWTQCEHEENGPIGPFCYFPSELCKTTSVVLVT